MTATLPSEVQDVFERFVTTELTTVDGHGQPIAWPVTPYYRRGEECIAVTTALGYPKKAHDARRNPKVALLFSDPTGCGLEDPPMVLVQGIAHVDDRDLEANRERYARESVAKLPATRGQQPPAPLQRFFGWYYTRLYINVRPERVYVWPRRDPGAEPQLLDSHMEEVRSGHDEEPDVPHARPVGGAPTWDERMEELGSRYPTAVLALAAPDGFPFATRVPVRPESAAARVRIDAEAVGVPIQPGLACLTAHAHDDELSWQRNFQIRGDLVEDDDGWAVVPHRVVGGFELPEGSPLARVRANIGKVRRFRRTAKRELARRGG